MSDLLSNDARPPTDATITVRVIKSLTYRTERSIVLHHIDLLSTTVGRLKEITNQGRVHPLQLPSASHAPAAVQTQPGWKPYRNVHLDTLKLYTKAHGSKTSNLIINLDHDEWILDDDSKTLAQVDFENETEVSFFNRQDYEEFKLNPETSWDV
ncbi:hypothetical protein NLJ89_g4267 [Agrocybe chaxingu]|uniref:Cytoplasmic protein n=1 Tax=Agrocybe chaxingu TaxID=84603 RepID=A0A9W8MWP2_9AGAR|nr:hypothetical protein NLJ89_g4267 [Agrocybe chaxingu]